MRTTLGVLRGFARDHPKAPRVGVGDLSVRGGGDFGPEVGGGIGHATHQNGLDVDVYYPLKSEAERAPLSVGEVDVALAQDLVDRFVAAGAVTVYVGPNLPLTGPPGDRGAPGQPRQPPARALRAGLTQAARERALRRDGHEYCRGSIAAMPRVHVVDETTVHPRSEWLRSEHSTDFS